MKVHCTMVLLISHISAVSRNVKSQSVSISSRINANLLSSVKVGMSTLSLSLSKLYHLLIAYATNKLKPLKHWDNKRMNSRKFGRILEFSRPLQKNTRTRCSTQKSDIVIFQTFHLMYLTTKYHKIIIRITAMFKFSTSDIRCLPDTTV